MSSILDALNKLEEDKVLAQSPPEGSEDLDPDSVGEELVGRSVLRDRITLKFTPLTLLVGGLIATVVVVSFSVVASLLVVRSSGPAEESAIDSRSEGVSAALPVQLPENGASDSAEVAGAETRPALSEDGTASAAVPESENLDLSSRQPVEDQFGSAAAIAEVQEVSEAASPLASPDATRADPAPERLVVSQTQAPVVEAPPDNAPLRAESGLEPGRPAEPPAPDVETRPPSRPEEVVPNAESQSLTELPILTQADRARYTDGRLMINMVNPASETNPYGYAVINVFKVFEGHNIPSTQFQLIGVEMGGIGVAVQGTTKRFFIPW